MSRRASGLSMHLSDPLALRESTHPGVLPRLLRLGSPPASTKPRPDPDVAMGSWPFAPFWLGNNEC